KLAASVRVSSTLSSKYGHFSSLLAQKVQDGDGQNAKLQASKQESTNQRDITVATSIIFLQSICEV
ncbi:hypothetical protein ACXWPE_09375, partial [Streptococcus pyogenes]